MILYRPTSGVKDFADIGFVWIHWFCWSRSEPLVSVEENMAHYEHLDAEGRARAKIRLAELVSAEESEVIKACVTPIYGEIFSSYAVHLPLWPWYTTHNVRSLIGTWRSQPTTKSSGFVLLGEGQGCTLPVEIRGYYSA